MSRLYGLVVQSSVSVCIFVFASIFLCALLKPAISVPTEVAAVAPGGDIVEALSEAWVVVGILAFTCVSECVMIIRSLVFRLRYKDIDADDVVRAHDELVTDENKKLMDIDDVVHNTALLGEKEEDKILFARVFTIVINIICLSNYILTATKSVPVLFAYGSSSLDSYHTSLPLRWVQWFCTSPLILALVFYVTIDDTAQDQQQQLQQQQRIDVDDSVDSVHLHSQDENENENENEDENEDSRIIRFNRFASRVKMSVTQIIASESKLAKVSIGAMYICLAAGTLCDTFLMFHFDFVNTPSSVSFISARSCLSLHVLFLILALSAFLISLAALVLIALLHKRKESNNENNKNLQKTKVHAGETENDELVDRHPIQAESANAPNTNQSKLIDSAPVVSNSHLPLSSALAMMTLSAPATASVHRSLFPPFSQSPFSLVPSESLSPPPPPSVSPLPNVIQNQQNHEEQLHYAQQRIRAFHSDDNERKEVAAVEETQERKTEMKEEEKEDATDGMSSNSNSNLAPPLLPLFYASTVVNLHYRYLLVLYAFVFVTFSLFPLVWLIGAYGGPISIELHQRLFMFCDVVAKAFLPHLLQQLHMTLRQAVREVSAAVHSARAYERLQHEQQKISFLRYLFHEIRNPINIAHLALTVSNDITKRIYASSQVVDVGVRTFTGSVNERLKKRCERISRHVQSGLFATMHTSKLLDDIMLLEKLDYIMSSNHSKHPAPQFSFDPHYFILHSVCKQLLFVFSTHQRRLRFKLDFDDKLKQVNVFGDPFRIKQVFFNLLSGASRSAPPGSVVSFKVRLSDHQPDPSSSSSSSSSSSCPSLPLYIRQEMNSGCPIGSINTVNQAPTSASSASAHTVTLAYLDISVSDYGAKLSTEQIKQLFGQHHARYKYTPSLTSPLNSSSPMTKREVGLDIVIVMKLIDQMGGELKMACTRDNHTMSEAQQTEDANMHMKVTVNQEKKKKLRKNSFVDHHVRVFEVDRLLPENHVIEKTTFIVTNLPMIISPLTSNSERQENNDYFIDIDANEDDDDDDEDNNDDDDDDVDVDHARRGGARGGNDDDRAVVSRIQVHNVANVEKNSTDHSLTTHAPTTSSLLTLSSNSVLISTTVHVQPPTPSDHESSKLVVHTALNTENTLTVGGVSAGAALSSRFHRTRVKEENKITASSPLNLSSPMSSSPGPCPSLHPSPHPSPSPSPGSSAPGPDIRILVVDDILLNRRLLCRILTAHGHTSATAVDGVDCLERMSDPRANFTVVLMDNSMPRMNGVDCTKEIKARFKNVYVVGVTGNTLENDLREFRESGVIDVLSKPVDAKRLIAIVEDCLSKAKT